MIDALTLPEPLLRRIGAAASEMMGSAPGMDFDFAAPAGEPALVSADSVSWRVFKNPVSLFIGGVAAVLLELAEPGVRDGVWQHSSFRTDALTRLRRTGLAAMMTVYGPRSRAEAMIAGVVRAHGRVSGTTSEGAPYSASDPVLLDWVQATASYGFIRAYHAYVTPLSYRERDSALAEGAAVARLYGAVGAPTSEAKMAALFAGMDVRLVPSPIIGEFLEIMRTVPALPWVARPFQRTLLRAAVSLLPDPLIDRLGLEEWRLRGFERRLVKLVAGVADRVPLLDSPPARASERLGLPADWLWQKR
ncbi:oxygenase MpaB family protein [Sphingomonas sp. HITSZ_GF]|uniref:oxygenase MpaB family protein n=1 Tax=Sphingomonas sp. HITSZ_GF TaxID=3037247 RepID=UPI00240DBB5C|nr:oxygenase MpaB family protein [Sphingomonas sp. HITSZ_GF]MDG2535508.1 oxygenase MpaB family protein [Sphingomonas sp. HITSZ_GF]